MNTILHRMNPQCIMGKLPGFDPAADDLLHVRVRCVRRVPRLRPSTGKG